MEWEARGIACEWSKSQMPRKSASKWQCEQRRTKNGQRRRYDENVFITNCIKKHRTYLIVSVPLARKRNTTKKCSKKSSVKHYRAQHFGGVCERGRVHGWTMSGNEMFLYKFYIASAQRSSSHKNCVLYLSCLFRLCDAVDYILRLVLRLSPRSTNTGGTRCREHLSHPNDDDDTQVPLTFSLCIAHSFLSFACV